MGKKVKTSTPTVNLELFVSGLPYECDQAGLKEFFGSQAIVDVKMPKFQDSGRCLGYAHLVFNDQAEYQAALARNGDTIGTRYLKIEAAKGKKPVQVNKNASVPVGCKTIFVKNLPYDCTKDEIGEFFSSCGIVTDIRMVYNWANKHFKGFAYLDYREPASVRKAMRTLNGSNLRGRALVIDAVITSHKKGYKRRDPSEYQDQQEQDQ